MGATFLLRPAPRFCSARYIDLLLAKIDVLLSGRELKAAPNLVKPSSEELACYWLSLHGRKQNEIAKSMTEQYAGAKEPRKFTQTIVSRMITRVKKYRDSGGYIPEPNSIPKRPRVFFSSQIVDQKVSGDQDAKED